MGTQKFYFDDSHRGSVLGFWLFVFSKFVLQPFSSFLSGRIPSISWEPPEIHNHSSLSLQSPEAATFQLINMDGSPAAL